jgi:hypothetical protein
MSIPELGPVWAVVALATAVVLWMMVATMIRFVFTMIKYRGERTQLIDTRLVREAARKSNRPSKRSDHAPVPAE